MANVTGLSDFEDDELVWLVNLERPPGIVPPKEVEHKFVEKGVADRTDSGLKITGLGTIILDEARASGRIPPRTM